MYNYHEAVIPSESQIVDLGENIVWDKEKVALLKDRYPVSLTRHEIILMQLLVEYAE